MARRGGAGILMAIARDVARQQRQAAAAQNRSRREAERQHRASEREAVRAEREYARSAKEAEREEKARYLQQRELEAQELNATAEAKLSSFEDILAQTLSVDDTISFSSLRLHDLPPSFEPPAHLLSSKAAPEEAAFLSKVSPKRWFDFLVPGSAARREGWIQSAMLAYQAAMLGWQQQEDRRIATLRQVEGEHSKAVKAFNAKKAQRDAEVDAFEADYKVGDPDAILAYINMVLERSSYPDEFPHSSSVAYTSASKQVVVEYELPTIEIVPDVVEYRYVRSSDSIAEKKRKISEMKDIYQDIIASVALRTLHEIFESDQGSHVQVICFNGYIHTVDPATGRDIQPHLISVRTTSERFGEIDLFRVDKSICLRNLGAQVSRRPEEAQPVKPIVEFDMADARFVDQTDMVSGLSSATNLMELTPTEFEHLVANLFGQMGLESKLTRSSRDGGVDCVAYDPRPVLGGKVVIQAKRYRNTVGVSAVRDLFGTMMNEGANKGILVTTSGYGPDAFDFAKDKPIELIDGGGLLYLLQEIGTQARIVFPQEV
jgi:restriction system protein